MRGFSFLHRTLAAAACAALVSPSIVAAQSSEQMLVPSSPWQLDAGENRCRLARQFGEGSEAHLLIMETEEPTASVNLVLTGPTTDKVIWRRSVEFRFGDLESIEVERVWTGSFGDHGTGLMANGVRLDEPKPELAIEDKRPRAPRALTESVHGLPEIPSKRFAGVATLRLSQRDRVLVTLELRGLEKALEALNDCSQNFISYWGLDLEKHKSMRQGPRWTNFKEVVRSTALRFPRNAARQDDQGVVRFLVFVDEEGRVSGCRQSNATELAILKSPICDEMQRAQFEPALDADGNPMPSYYASRIHYLMQN